MNVLQLQGRNQFWNDITRDSQQVFNMVRAIRNDNDDQTSRPIKGYTPESATETLPLVRRIMQDLMRLSGSIKDQKEQIRGIDGLSETMEQTAYQEELRDMRASLARDETRFEECLGELASLGLIAHRPIDGCVDFPARSGEREVFLCWNINDPAVNFWHTPNSLDRTTISDQAFDTAN